MPRSRNPGFKQGDYWMICDVSGVAYRRSEMVKRWDGYWVHKKYWNPRQPQDFVRGRNDRITPQGPIRPDDTSDSTDTVRCKTTSGVAGIAVAGCAIAGDENRDDICVPTGTFNNSLLEEDYVVSGFVDENFVNSQ